MKAIALWTLLGCLAAGMLPVTAAEPPKTSAVRPSANGTVTPGANPADALKMAPNANDEMYKNMAMLVAVMQLLNRDYVDPDRVTFHRMLQGALVGVLASLDRYSSYLPPADLKGMLENTAGHYVGIGVTYSWNGKFMRIEKIAPDSPAYRAGLQVGDEIFEVDGRRVADLKLAQCVELLRGETGSAIKVSYRRPGVPTTTEVEVIRDKVLTSPIPDNCCRVLDHDIGYVHIKIFSDPLAGTLDAVLQKFQGQKLKGLVLDLRDNPGGKLDAAIQVCSRFIPEGKTVVSVVGRRPQDKVVYRAVGGTKELTLPLVVLINHNSASAAEIMAGCLKDYRRAVLVGENTFGKASVQRVQQLPANYGGIRFTIAYYHTPNDIRIHEHGIDPDVRVEIPAADRSALFRQLARFPGEIKPSAPGTVTDLPLQRAVELLRSSQIFSNSQK